MVILKQFLNKTYITVDDKIVIYNPADDLKEIKLPPIILPPNLTKGQIDVLQKEDREISTLSISKDGRILVSTQNKQVVAFDSDLNVTHNFALQRAASKARFTPTNEILIADKTGDAFLYSNSEPQLILGHLSMMLDVLVTDCGKYIVTCDRDEKIRVSHYPNAYNIACFCLGHGEFVTNVEMAQDVLLSASGDGTIRLWNYKSGLQLSCIDTNSFLDDKSAIAAYCEKMDADKVEVKALPITDMQVYESNGKTLIAATLLRSNCVQIYEMVAGETRHLQNVVVDAALVAFSLGRELIVLTVQGFVVYVPQSDGSFVKIDSNLNSVFVAYNLVNNFNDDDVSVLYKRKFDNVQEYLERKKQRIESK